MNHTSECTVQIILRNLSFITNRPNKKKQKKKEYEVAVFYFNILKLYFWILLKSLPKRLRLVLHTH